MRIEKLILLTVLIFAFYGCSKNVEDIINENIIARGGAAQFNNIKTLTADAKATSAGFEIPMNMVFMPPGKMWLKMTLMGKDITTVVSDERGWVIGDSMVQMIPPEQLNDLKQQMKSQLSFFKSELSDYKSKGYNAILVGKETIENKESYKLKLITKENDSIFYFIDASNYQDIKMAGNVRDRMTGKMYQQETYFKDFKKVGNLLMPHLIEVKSEGKTEARMIFSNIRINEKVDTKLFELPEAAAMVAAGK